MVLFAYKAYSPQGAKTNGTIEANTQDEAKEKLRELSLILYEIKQQDEAKKAEQLSKDNLIVFSSQLTQLISAKIPLYESLLALEEQARKESYHAVVASLAERIKRGVSFSKALQEFPLSFPPLYRAVVAAGEASGNLELSLSRLYALLNYQRKIAKQIISAMTYPFFLVGLLIAAISILVGFVIPSLEVLFEGREVPAFTQFIFSTSHVLRSSWWFILLVLIGSSFFTFRYVKTPKGKEKFERLLLSLPIISRFSVHSALSRFSKTLSCLLDGGLPLPASILYAKDALKNSVLEKIIQNVEERLVEGKPMSEELSRYKEIPPLFVRMVKIGEETGRLSAMLLQIATIYEEDTERTLTRLVSLIQPVLLLLMGVLIGGVLLSILLPLSSFGSNLSF